MTTEQGFNRRGFLKAGGTVLVAGGLGVPALTMAQGAKIKVGLMLPYTGTFSPFGIAIDNGFRLALAKDGGKLGGREVEIYKVDDESDPAKAVENINRLVTRDKVDVVVGTVHSGVVAGMIRVTRESGTLHMIPIAGLKEATGSLCSPNIFRTSFSNWQLGYGMGVALSKRPNVKNVATLTWNYAAGQEFVKGFKDGFLKGHGKIAKELWLPFPSLEFQALLTELASLKPDATFAFVAGGGGLKFLKDYAQAGLMKTIPLVGTGYMTDGGILAATGGVAEGVETTLYYSDDLNTPTNTTFREAYKKAYSVAPDAASVTGYDAALLLLAGTAAVKGDLSRRKELISAIEGAKIDSPRGAWTMSKFHNPIQDIYLRKVVGTENHFTEVAVKAVDDDPDNMKLCKMSS